MARADYEEQLRRHVGEWDVLPNALAVPLIASRTDSTMHGEIELCEEVLRGNRWPAVSGALLAEFAYRCAMVGVLTVLDEDRRAFPRSMEIRFRKAIPVAEARSRPRVADGATSLQWTAAIEFGSPFSLRAAVRLTRQPAGSRETVLAVEARVEFDISAISPPIASEKRLRAYLSGLPRRLALPAYRAGWTGTEIHGECKEPPGSLLGVAEQALGDAGKIVRGEGVPADEHESMLLASMNYQWVQPVNDALVQYTAHPGPRRFDDRGRAWVDASATLTLDGGVVGRATGQLVFLRVAAQR